MWEVYEHRRVVGRLRRLPVEILKRYEKWKDIVRVSGPQGLRLIKGFHDEALRGRWENHRSSRLGLQYRVIYRIEERRVQVLVVEVFAMGTFAWGEALLSDPELSAAPQEAARVSGRGRALGAKSRCQP